MERFKHLALIYSGSPDDRNLLSRTAALAERNQARITAVATLEPLSAAAQLLLGRERVEQFVASRQQELQGALDADLRRLKLKALPLQFVHGTPSIEVIRLLQREGCDLLVKVRDNPAKGRAISATDRKLLRKCPVPVLLLKARRKRHFTRILAAVDPDPSQPERLELHRTVLTLAISLAEREGAALDVVYAWDMFSAATLQGPRFKLTSAELNAIIEQEQRTYRGWLDKLLAPHAAAAVPIELHLVQGDPPATIIDLARRRKSDLLVMGTVARGGLPGLLIGNTAETVLDSVDCSTLTIKPPDFVCPISP